MAIHCLGGREGVLHVARFGLQVLRRVKDELIADEVVDVRFLRRRAPAHTRSSEVRRGVQLASIHCGGHYDDELGSP